MLTSLRQRLVALVRRPLRRRSPSLRVRVPSRRREFRVAHQDVVIHEDTSVQARVLARAARLVLKPMLRFTPFNDRTLLRLQSINRLSARGPRSRFVEPVAFELGGVPVESMTHRHGPSSAMTVLYLHGGGFFSCGIDTHRRICERLALYTGGVVVSADYVQLPHGAVADSVQDAIAAYEALLEIAEDPTKVVVAGDSAGGYLTMKVAELATRRGLQAPAALLGFSPLLSLDPETEKESVQRVIRVRDAYLPVARIGLARERWAPAGYSIEGSDSPLEATDLIDSPTFLVGVEDEMLRPEIEAMALLLSRRDVRVETHLWRGQVHAFPVMADALPESKQALKLAADFARHAVGESQIHPDVADSTHEEPVTGELIDDEPEPADDVIDVELETPGGDARRRWFFRAG